MGHIGSIGLDSFEFAADFGGWQPPGFTDGKAMNSRHKI